MLIFLVWLSGFIEKLNDVLHWVLGVSLVLVAASVFIYVLNSDQYYDSEKFWFAKSQMLFKRAFVVLFISLTLFITLPSKNVFYAMVGVYAGQEIIANPKAQELFDKSIKAIEIKLDEVIEKSKGEKQ